MSSLAAIVRAEIRSSGSISFERFMELALYHPEWASTGASGIDREPDEKVISSPV